MIPKFRVWDTVKKAMSEVQAIVYAEERVYPIYSKVVRRYVPFSESILMQSTHLKDKNGVEIFEGDVVKFTDYWDDFGPEGLEGDIEGHNFGEVLMTVDGPKIGRVAEVGGCVHERQNEERASFSELVNSLDFEVIGNIYNNPELLEHPDFRKE